MYKQGVCLECKQNRIIANQKFKLCNYHNTLRLNAKKPKIAYRIPKKTEKQKEVTRQDISFFKRIWETRPHLSEITEPGEPEGRHLGDEFNVCFFSHILTKQAMPYFRHDERNILLMTFDQHQEWEFTDRKGSKWNHARDIAEELTLEYYTRLNK